MNPIIPQEYFVTFPQRLPTKDNYQRVKAISYAEARKLVFDAHGNRFAFMYPIEQLKRQEDAYGLTELFPVLED